MKVGGFTPCFAAFLGIHLTSQSTTYVKVKFDSIHDVNTWFTMWFTRGPGYGLDQTGKHRFILGGITKILPSILLLVLRLIILFNSAELNTLCQYTTLSTHCMGLNLKWNSDLDCQFLFLSSFKKGPGSLVILAAVLPAVSPAPFNLNTAF